jgi:hypothetical protein
MLTPEQRYWQALKKARLRSRRNFRRVMEGKEHVIWCLRDMEKAALIEELGRAYEAGRSAALNQTSNKGENDAL